MTRESRARALALATAVLVVLLAAVFAALRNVAPAPPSAPTAAPAADAGRTGRDAFAALGCAACHAPEGHGNASLPLDGIGRRLDRDALRAGAFGTAPDLPAPVAAIKRTRAADPRADALLDYLQRLQ